MRSVVHSLLSLALAIRFAEPFDFGDDEPDA